MKIIVGLGNPGRQYEYTRHNVGWMVLDRVADRVGWGGRQKSRDAAAVARGRYGDLDLVLAKPMTYMNLSGLAVRKLLARERAPLQDLLIVVDDFALPLGRLRLRSEGSTGGHNGLRSIVAEMGTQRFARLRVGIGDPGQRAIDHVLSRFTANERSSLDVVLEAAADAVIDWASEGPDRAANRWNAWRHQALEEADEIEQVPAREAVPAIAANAAVRDRAVPEADVLERSVPEADVLERSAPDADGIVRTRTGWRKLLKPRGAGTS